MFQKFVPSILVVLLFPILFVFILPVSSFLQPPHHKTLWGRIVRFIRRRIGWHEDAPYTLRGITLHDHLYADGLLHAEENIKRAPWYL